MRKLIQNIKRLISWIPIIWKDRDYDYYHLFNILYFKLDRMSKDTGYNRYLVRGNRYIRQLKYAALLSKLIKDFDHFEDNEIDIKYGRAEFSFEKEPVSEYSSMKVTRTKLTDANMNQYILDLENNMLKNERKYIKLLSRLSKHIKKYHRNWWN